MQDLLLLSIGLASVGGAMAFAALFHHYAHAKAVVPTVKTDGSSVKILNELKERERAFTEYCERVGDELDEKSRVLETLTVRASEAASALSAALTSIASALGEAQPVQVERNAPTVCNGTPYQLTEFTDADVASLQA